MSSGAKRTIAVLMAVTSICLGALAQSAGPASAPAVCTDLSGKVAVPCPGEGTSGGRRAPSPAAPPKAPQTETVPSAADSRAGSSLLNQGCTDLSGKIAVSCPGQKSAGKVETAGTMAPAPQAGEAIPTPAPVQPAAGETPPASRVTAAASALHPASMRQPIGYEPVAVEPAPAMARAPSTMAAEPVVTSSEPTTTSPPERALVRNLVSDQKAIWTSPLRLRLRDMQWLAPLLGGTAVVMASDTDIQSHVPTGTNFRKQSNDFSNYGVAAFGGITGAAWLWGVATHNDHLRETGLLSGEAALDSLALTYAIKNITNRNRPYESNGHGDFWSKGDSFPSEHATAAWSVATVLAHEYPGPLTKLLAYGGAAAVSAARVTADKHFASDALVGSAIGYFIGRQVYRAHHNHGLGDAAYGTFERAPGAEGPRNPEDMGSTYVALDSWVYPAMDRLAALGYTHSAFAALRPWTRMECARLLDEAANRIPADRGAGGGSAEAVRLFRALQAEFFVETRRLGGDRNLSAELESVYTRFTGISGKPLNDSYHFGQTIINDYGRPYQEGFNMVTGFTSRAEAGPLAFYVRGEYQHAPSAPPYPLNVRQAIATMDENPLLPGVPFAGQDKFQLLDTYAAVNIKNNQISFGRQSLWWGPGQGGALMFSNNALPFYMLRWTQPTPFRLPWFFGLLGPMRTEVFIGRLEGHNYPAHPYITGQKISFKPTENLELGFSKMAVFAGGDQPLTWRNFYKANFSIGDHPTADLLILDPGDRRSQVTFSYKVPGLRKWLTLYGDSLSDDDPSPLAAPRRAAMNPGIYLSHVPGVPKLDFRAEAGYTDVVAGRSVKGQFIYFNTNYHDSHTNNGNIMGSWIGREGRGLQLSSTYWFSPQATLQFGYRSAEVAKDFVPGGGDLKDFSVQVNMPIRSAVAVQSWVQYERWKFPLLAGGSPSNVTAAFQITYRPRLGLGK